MKYYQAEMEAIDFAKHSHTLRDWANYGFNKVIYDGHEYWDGLEDGNYKIPEHEADEILICEAWDYDEEGSKFLMLTKEGE